MFNLHSRQNEIKIRTVVRSGDRDLGVIQIEVKENLRRGVNGLEKEKYDQQKVEKPKDTNLSSSHISVWERERKQVRAK